MKFYCGGRDQRGGTVVVIMCATWFVGFDAETVAVEVAHDFQGFGMVFLGGGFGIACRLEQVSFGKFAGQGVLRPSWRASACSLSAARRYHSRLRVGVGRQEGRPAGFVRRYGRLARLVRVLFGLCVVGVDACAVEVGFDRVANRRQSRRARPLFRIVRRLSQRRLGVDDGVPDGNTRARHIGRRQAP